MSLTSWLFGAPVPTCTEGGARHNFEARNTTNRTFNNLSISGGVSPDDLERLMKAATDIRETYHGDVCTWCGKTTKP